MFNLLSFLRRRLRRPRKADDESTAKRSGGNNGLSSAAAIHPNPVKAIRVATFNPAMFSMAPAVPNNTAFPLRSKSTVDLPKSILKPMNATPDSRKLRFAKSRLRVSINLPDNEITSQLSFREDPQHSPLRPALSFSGEIGLTGTRTILEVLRRRRPGSAGRQGGRG